ncbi:hypothetical protein C0993_003552 [Termitomyces sp. T159_Od127]|nr:hypothetical protein C0993_003552 [Termitomyces sp. T159_Od127]
MDMWTEPPWSAEPDSKRREKHGKGNKAAWDMYHRQVGMLVPGLFAKAVAPLEVSANWWDHKAIGAKEDKVTLVDQKVKVLLNKLAMDKFDLISDQIVEWANQLEDENDGKMLMQVIVLVFEKATDEATWLEMYMQLCWKMMEKLSPAVRDKSIVLQDSKAIAGGQLVCKYLLHRCLEEFEHGWAVKEATAMAAAKKPQTRRRAIDVCEGWMDGLEGGTGGRMYQHHKLHITSTFAGCSLHALSIVFDTSRYSGRG